MVSILIPSRARPKLLQSSINSLGSGKKEVLVWVDDDDPRLQEYAEVKGATLFIRPRVGYMNFYKMINFLAKESSGEWLVLFNDDMRIDSGDLFGALENFDFTKPQVLNFWDPTNPRNNLAPVVSRSMYDAMGHFSLNTHCDSWVQDIANTLDIHYPIFNVGVTHLREVLDDETKHSTQAVYPISSPHYDSPEVQKLRDKDIERLRVIL